MLTAILVYIMTVGLTYNTVLRSLWKPQGLQLLADNLLHSIIPFLYLVFWIFFVKKQSLQWKDVFSWLVYPLVISYIYSDTRIGFRRISISVHRCEPTGIRQGDPERACSNRSDSDFFVSFCGPFETFQESMNQFLTL